MMFDDQLPRLQIRNIKVSLIIEPPLGSENLTGKIFNHKGAVITIYPNNKSLINVTKLKTIEELYNIEREIEALYNVRIKESRIDAIMLSRKVKNKRYSEKKYLETLANYKHLYKLDYNHESFHAPWLKSLKPGGGSFNIFSTGSCTVLGVKSIKYIALIEKILNEVFCTENEIK